jgi:DNA damage-inducible protein 1
MLYVDVKVNDIPIKAFVDSGAQTTIMSPSCAESCGLSYLIDERFGGIARGVGTARILGRVHQAKIQIGDAELDCAFTVMEGKDVDLLFGLDMLRRHQASIDLLAGELRFPHTKVKFLPESEIPKKFEESIMDEPTVPAPGGMEVGANTGSVRPAGSSAAAASHLHPGGGESSSSGAGKQPVGASAPSQPGASSSSTPAAQPPRPQAPTPARAASRWPEDAIQSLINLGVDRERAIAALDATGGNADYAASMLLGL